MGGTATTAPRHNPPATPRSPAGPCDRHQPHQPASDQTAAPRLQGETSVVDHLFRRRFSAHSIWSFLSIYSEAFQCSQHLVLPQHLFWRRFSAHSVWSFLPHHPSSGSDLTVSPLPRLHFSGSWRHPEMLGPRHRPGRAPCLAGHRLQTWPSSRHRPCASLVPMRWQRPQPSRAAPFHALALDVRLL